MGSGNIPPAAWLSLGALLALGGGLARRTTAPTCRGRGRRSSSTAAAGLPAEALGSGLVCSPVSTKGARRCPGGGGAPSPRTDPRHAAACPWSGHCFPLADTRSRGCRLLTDGWSLPCWRLADARSGHCLLLADTRCRRWHPWPDGGETIPAAIARCLGIALVAEHPSRGPGRCRSSPPRIGRARIPGAVRAARPR